MRATLRYFKINFEDGHFLGLCFHFRNLQFSITTTLEVFRTLKILHKLYLKGRYPP